MRKRAAGVGLETLTAQYDIATAGQGLLQQADVVGGHLGDPAVPPAALVEVGVVHPIQRPVGRVQAVVLEGRAAAVMQQDQGRARAAAVEGGQARVDQRRVLDAFHAHLGQRRPVVSRRATCGWAVRAWVVRLAGPLSADLRKPSDLEGTASSSPIRICEELPVWERLSPLDFYGEVKRGRLGAQGSKGLDAGGRSPRGQLTITCEP